MDIIYKNEEELNFKKIVDIERVITKKQSIKENTKPCLLNLSCIKKRKPSSILEKVYNFPQNIFLIKLKKDLFIVGRKTISKLFIQKKINAFNCSLINSSMFLGILKSKNKDGNSISIVYYPFTHSEKLGVFHDISKDRMIKIEYPFRYINFQTKKEKSSSAKGWSINTKKVIYLGHGEKHYREYIINYLSRFNLVSCDTIIYDPACSTGQFLHEIKVAFPTCKTIGQDLSCEMTNYSKQFIDTVYCGDSIFPMVPNNYVDILILRFLNSEVVTTYKAYKIFNKLITTINNNGLIFCFGHTPVLIRLKYFLKKELTLLHGNGYNKKDNSIFQLFIFKKNNKNRPS